AAIDDAVDDDELSVAGAAGIATHRALIVAEAVNGIAVERAARTASACLHGVVHDRHEAQRRAAGVVEDRAAVARTGARTRVGVVAAGGEFAVHRRIGNVEHAGIVEDRAAHAAAGTAACIRGQAAGPGAEAAGRSARPLIDRPRAAAAEAADD